MSRSVPRRGFTLLELFVVLAIIATLLALLMPAVLRVRREAARAADHGNLYQLGFAVGNYESTYGEYPHAIGLGDDDRRPMHSWRVAVLPFIEGHDIYNRYDVEEPWDGPSNRQLAPLMPRIYALRSNYRPGVPVAHCTVIVGLRAPFPPDRARKQDELKDRLGTTIMLAENRGANLHWMEPRDLNFTEMDFTLGSPNGISSKYDDPGVVMFDGSYRRLSKDISPDVLRALLMVEPAGRSDQ